MKRKNKIVVAILLCCISVSISAIFWLQEFQYSLPTPVPLNYKEVSVGTDVRLNTFVQYQGPKLLHFYNPSCPCSKFNATHIKHLHQQYGKEILFFVVIEKESDRVREEFNFPVILDEEGILADACGVYSTPQAVILDDENKIYYRGNYNKKRYCTTKNTNFAEIAIVNLLGGNQNEKFSESATRSYGCQLNSDILDNNNLH